MAVAAGDLITQLQECNAQLCAHLFNFTGAIQRDAPPLSVGGEPLEQSDAAPAGADTVTQIPDLAMQVVHLSKQFDELASHLPHAMPPRQQQLQTIVKLQEEAEAGRQELLTELEAAKTQLQRVHQLYGHLADDRLQVQDNMHKTAG